MPVTDAGQPLVGSVRINRYLAECGLASRRGADALVAEGRVRVDGRAVSLGSLVDPSRSRVTVDGLPVPAPLPRRTLLLNKPIGVVSTRRDPQGRRTVLDLVDDAAGLVPVGRLDADSRGLLLLSSDGDLAARLTHPRYGVVKTYRVTVRGRLAERSRRQAVEGVLLSDGPARALDIRRFGGGPGGEVIDVDMAEGRRREVRRLLAAVGASVSDLQRIAVGPIVLGHLHEGTCRRLGVAEERDLYSLVGLIPPTRRSSAASSHTSRSRA